MNEPLGCDRVGNVRLRGRIVVKGRYGANDAVWQENQCVPFYVRRQEVNFTGTVQAGAIQRQCGGESRIAVVKRRSIRGSNGSQPHVEIIHHHQWLIDVGNNPRRNQRPLELEVGHGQVVEAGQLKRLNRVVEVAPFIRAAVQVGPVIVNKTRFLACEFGVRWIAVGVFSRAIEGPVNGQLA